MKVARRHRTKRCRAGSIRWLRELYADLNREFFKGELPKGLAIEWAKLPGTIIARVKWHSLEPLRETPKTFKPYVMQFSRMLKHAAFQKQVGMSMLHEMAHLKCGVAVSCTEWDGEFDKEMFRLAADGAFRYFW